MFELKNNLLANISMGRTSSARETSALDLPITEYHLLILYRVMSNWKKCNGCIVGAEDSLSCLF